VDLDGNFQYSQVMLVGGTATAAARATIFASGKTVSVLLQNETGSRLIVRVITLGGQVLQQESFESAAGRIDLNVAAATAGVYVVQLTDGNQFSLATKVIL